MRVGHAIVDDGNGLRTHRSVDLDTIVLPDTAETFTDRTEFQIRLDELRK